MSAELEKRKKEKESELVKIANEIQKHRKAINNLTTLGNEINGSIKMLDELIGPKKIKK